MRRRDFTTGLLLAAAVGAARAQERAKQHRIVIVVPAGPVALISETGHPFWRAILEELRRLGDVEGQNLIVERYSAEGRTAGYADLAREVVTRKPDVIVAATAITQAVNAAAPTIPIVWVGADPIRAGLVTSLARPGGNITGVSVDAGIEIWGKRLQILKEAVPSASKVAVLATPTAWESGDGKGLREASQRLEIPLIAVLLRESAPSEYQRVFADIVQQRPDAIIVSAAGELSPSRQLIVELVEKNRLPAIYPSRDYMEAGGLMAYAVDWGELGRRMADDVHQILNGAKPGDIPIYQPTKFEFVINIKAAKALGLTLPPALLASADEVIE
jgi:putative ABC transport system substrate-binding protein